MTLGGLWCSVSGRKLGLRGPVIVPIKMKFAFQVLPLIFRFENALPDEQALARRCGIPSLLWIVVGTHVQSLLSPQKPRLIK